MPRRVWNVNVDDVDHAVELKHSYLSGKKHLFLDCKPVLQTGVTIIDLKADLRFLIGTHPCLVRIVSNGITADYDLIIDGNSTQTGLPVSGEAPAGTASESATERAKIEKRLISGTNWFVLIGLFSMLNSLFHLAFNSSLTFIIGLGISQILDGIGPAFGEKGKWVAGIGSYAFTIGFIALATFARKRRSWAYLTGMILYGLDCLILLAVKDYLGVAFHVFVLVWVYIGWRALQQLKKAEKEAVTEG